MEVTKPSYYDSFRCLASSCPDSCCKEWDVDVDEVSAARYRCLPGELGEALRQNMKQTEYGTQMMAQEGRCPMWRTDGLCRIQAELGEDWLCQVCRAFPRLRHDYGDFLELGLELSCPEAARLILTAPPEPTVTFQTPGGEEPEYDKRTMEVLKASRSWVLTLLDDYPTSMALILMLFYSAQTQAALDGGGAPEMDVSAALLTGEMMPDMQETEEFFSFFEHLEILTPRWAALLKQHTVQPLPPQTDAFARYLVERYWLQAISDDDLRGRAKFIVISCLLVGSLPGDYIENAQLYSKEIENDADNVDALLDAAWEEGCFADARLMKMLKQRKERPS